jgi:hypothetical protein
MKLFDIFLLEQSHSGEKLFKIHGAGKVSSMLVYFSEMLCVKFLGEVEFFAEDHPFVYVHLVCLFEVLAEETFWVVGLFAESLEG